MNHGASLFSEWYTPGLVQERAQEKQLAIAKRVELGEIKNAERWGAKSKERFQRYFDRLSEETRRTYQSSARHFGKYLGLKRSDSKVSNIVARLIMLSYSEGCTLVEEYVQWMQEDQLLSPSTINTRLAALRWFVNAARRLDWVDWKLDVDSVKGGKVTDTDGPSDAEFRRILRVVNRLEGKSAHRDRLMIYMLSFMGLRISSVISLDYENIDFNKKRFKVFWKGHGNHYRWRPVGPRVFTALEDWLSVRGHHEGPIFTNLSTFKRGGRLTIRSARKIIKDIGAEARTEKVLRTHAFRHFHTTENLEATDGNAWKVMRSTGHTDVRTVEAYDDDRKDLAREVTVEMEERWFGDLDETEEADMEELEQEHEPDIDLDDDDEDLLGVMSADDAINQAEKYERISTGMPSVDNLLGETNGSAGLVRGSIVLVGGNPGIGKSTIVRQIAASICRCHPGEKVLYASGEESQGQIGEALKRLRCGHKRLLIVNEQSFNKICRIAEKLQVGTLIIDSVGMVTVEGKKNMDPGSITQVKAVGQYMVQWAKGVGEDEEDSGSGITVIAICHVDKKKNFAGPKALEHYVDALFMFEGIEGQKARKLMCAGKNRFGDATRVAHFNMTNRGLVEIDQENFDEDFEDD